MAGSLLADPEIAALLKEKTVLANSILGHLVDPDHISYFPDMKKNIAMFNIGAEPALLLATPTGKILWKSEGGVTKKELLAVLKKLH